MQIVEVLIESIVNGKGMLAKAIVTLAAGGWEYKSAGWRVAIRKDGNLFVGFPSERYPRKNGGYAYEDIVHLNGVARAEITKAILAEYHKKIAADRPALTAVAGGSHGA